YSATAASSSAVPCHGCGAAQWLLHTVAARMSLFAPFEWDALAPWPLPVRRGLVGEMKEGAAANPRRRGLGVLGPFPSGGGSSILRRSPRPRIDRSKTLRRAAGCAPDRHTDAVPAVPARIVGDTVECFLDALDRCLRLFSGLVRAAAVGRLKVRACARHDE